MKILKNILLGLATILILLLIVSFFLPKTAHVERSTTIGASPEEVFTHIKDLKTWNTWSPWFRKDSTMTNTYDGPDGEVGQKSIWTSEEVGNGSMTIIETIDNEKLVTKLEFDGRDGGKGTLLLEKVGDSTKVTWSLDGDLENVSTMQKPMTKYFFLAMDGMVGGDFESGLKYLKELAESTPKAEKPAYEIQEITMEPMMVLTLPKKRMKVEEMKPYFDEKMSELYGFALPNNIKAGKIHAQYYFWDGKETEVELMMPVDKEPANLGGYTFKEIPARKALLIDYYGSNEGSEAAHYAIDAYAKANSINITYPIEGYIVDISTEPDTSKWLTKIYYPISDGDDSEETEPEA